MSAQVDFLLDLGDYEWNPLELGDSLTSMAGPRPVNNSLYYASIPVKRETPD